MKMSDQFSGIHDTAPDDNGAKRGRLNNITRRD